VPSIVRVEQPDDPRLSPFRETRDGDALKRSGLFLGEGMLVLDRLLAHDARFAVRSMLVDERRVNDAIARIEAAVTETPAQIFVASPEIIESIIGFRFHQGVLVLGERGQEPDASAVLDSLELTDGHPSTLVILENLVDHDNIGSVFRNAAGFGAAAVLLSPSCGDPLYRKSVRTSMGHILRVPFGRFGDAQWPDGLQTLRDRGFVVLPPAPTPSTSAPSPPHCLPIDASRCFSAAKGPASRPERCAPRTPGSPSPWPRAPIRSMLPPPSPLPSTRRVRGSIAA
jgi:tRNA G18 (ribose-2'-O)-methylase SpoU